MTQDERTSQDAAVQLDARLRELPRDVAPGRDLWPDIAARIEARAPPVASTTRRPAWLWQAAAAVVLVAGSSLLTANLLDRSRPAQQSAVPVVPVNGIAASDAAVAMRAAFGPAGQLDPEYLAARDQLTQMLDRRIAALPLSARAKLEFNLGEMRRAADEINAALAEQPGDPLLEELLLKTYQDELAVLSNVSQLTSSLENTPVSTPGSPTGKRMQL
ncbi:MAG: hypothetical protein OEY13_00275 [Gammaproteobacteria bacterium]|nr:hypothetical protein [Gammaproteobacteria bacterium]